MAHKPVEYWLRLCLMVGVPSLLFGLFTGVISLQMLGGFLLLGFIAWVLIIVTWAVVSSMRNR
jgi:hypothetical protein